MNFILDVLAGDVPAARVGHDPLADDWSLAYLDTWVADPQAFPLSPPLPLRTARGHDARSIKRFIEHLVPEGRALDDAVAAHGLARSNVFGLIRALGFETAGALRFCDASGGVAPSARVDTLREVTVAELDARIADHATPLTIWDGKARITLAAAGAAELAFAPDYLDDERAFVARLAAFVDAQAARLARLATEAATLPDTFL
jgi:serine/threonine-protein kinase HipA